MVSASLRQQQAPQAAGGENSDHSLLRRFRRGSEDAATQLYLRYAQRLWALAKSRCPRELAARVDADDIVQSVFRCFFQAARRGFYDVAKGEELWKILLVIALNKIRSQRAFHRAAKRDVCSTAGGAHFESLLESFGHPGAAYGFLQVVIDDALDSLGRQHKHMVELRIQGYPVAQIADKTRRSRRTVERILQEARRQLEAIFHEADEPVASKRGPALGSAR